MVWEEEVNRWIEFDGDQKTLRRLMTIRSHMIENKRHEMGVTCMPLNDH